MSDELIPPIGSISAPERLFRVNWVGALERSPSGVPLHVPEFVARQGRRVRIIDIRERDELLGPLGYVPGSDWIGREHAMTLSERLHKDDPIIIVSRGGERSAQIAHDLEKRGMRFCASMRGGVVAWRSMGFSASRDPSILERRDVLRPIPVAESTSGPLDAAQIGKHVGDSVRWIKLAAVLLHGKRSCVDGRDDSAVVGTPGGDGGEIILGLASIEDMLGVELAPKVIAQLLARIVDAFGGLYMHTDVHAANELIKSMRADSRLTAAIGKTFETMEWRRWMRDPPESAREIVLEHLLKPGHLGCGHVKFLLTESSEYRVRHELVAEFVRAYLRQRWADSPQIELAPLAGGHQEGAVVNVRVEDELHAFSHVPLVSPSCAGTQMFVNHPQVSSYLRREMAALLCQQSDLLPGVEPDCAAELCKRIDALGAHQTGLTLARLAKGLPIYDVTFGRSGVRIEAQGVV